MNKKYSRIKHNIEPYRLILVKKIWSKSNHLGKTYYHVTYELKLWVFLSAGKKYSHETYTLSVETQNHKVLKIPILVLSINGSSY